MLSDRFSRPVRVALCLFASFSGMHAFASSNSNQDTHGSSGNDAGDPGMQQERWQYVEIPRFGIASMQQVLEVGSPANIAWLNIGEPIEHYQVVALQSPIANVNNGALVLYILPERCLGDFNNNGHIDLEDVVTFAIAYLNGEPAADVSGDGQIDVRDQILFLHLASIPCYSAW